MMDTGSPLSYLSGQIVVWTPRVLVAIIILIATHFVAKAIKWGLVRLLDKIPVMQRMKAETGNSLSEQLGLLVYWLIWLVGLVVALQPLGLAPALNPVHLLTAEVFAYVPRIIAAVMIFAVGLILARVVRNIVVTGLGAIHADRWFTRLTPQAPAAAAVDTGAAPSATPTVAPTFSRTLGAVVFALIIIPVAIAALQALGISSIVDPVVAVLHTVLAAIPRIFAAAILLGIAFFVARWTKALVEQVLTSLGFDNALGTITGGAGAASPSRVVGNIVLTAIMLFAAIEAARLIDFDAVAALLVQVTELGGQVIFGSVIIVVGVVIARIVSRLVGDAVGESGLPSILKYAIIALAVAIGLRFMGLANEIVNLAFGLILGSAAVACALAFGLGGRDTAHRLLEKWTSGRVVVPGASDKSDPPPKP